MSDLISMEVITHKIFVIRGKRVMLDRDLAQLYGVMTRRLNEQVKRNIKRFPEDFMFQLTKTEKNELVAICDRFIKLAGNVLSIFSPPAAALKTPNPLKFPTKLFIQKFNSEAKPKSLATNKNLMLLLIPTLTLCAAKCPSHLPLGISLS